MSEKLKNPYIDTANLVIEKLLAFDKQNHTYYSYYFDSGEGLEVLARILEEVDEQQLYQQQKGQKKLNA